MTISEFLERYGKFGADGRTVRPEGWTETELAEAAGCAPSHLNKLRLAKKREYLASIPVALGLESASGGKIRAEEVPLSAKSLEALKALRRAGGRRAGAR